MISEEKNNDKIKSDNLNTILDLNSVESPKINLLNNKLLKISIFLLVIISAVFIYKLFTTGPDSFNNENLFIGYGSSRDENSGPACPDSQKESMIAKCKVGNPIVVESTFNAYQDITERRDNVWRHFVHTWYCVSDDYLQNGPKDDDDNLLVTDGEYNQDQVWCLAPRKANIIEELDLVSDLWKGEDGQLVSENIRTNVKEAISEKIRELKWPEQGYKVCISENCLNAFRFFYGCVNEFSCQVVMAQGGDVLEISQTVGMGTDAVSKIPIVGKPIELTGRLIQIPGNIVGRVADSVFDLLDPTTKRPDSVSEEAIIKYYTD
jgi:hypothetical protein